MFLLRIIVFLILISLIMILAYPLLIVFDIATGGNGFGVCEDLLTCTIPITACPILIAGEILGLISWIGVLLVLLSIFLVIKE